VLRLHRTYEPSDVGLEAGRTDCPDRDCDGWAFRAQLSEPRIAHAHTSNKERLP